MSRGRTTKRDTRRRLSGSTTSRADKRMPVPEVAGRWNAMSGEKLSTGAVWQIIRRAELKLARLLKDVR